VIILSVEKRRGEERREGEGRRGKESRAEEKDERRGERKG